MRREFGRTVAADIGLDEIAVAECVVDTSEEAKLCIPVGVSIYELVAGGCLELRVRQVHQVSPACRYGLPFCSYPVKTCHNLEVVLSACSELAVIGGVGIDSVGRTCVSVSLDVCCCRIGEILLYREAISRHCTVSSCIYNFSETVHIDSAAVFREPLGRCIPHLAAFEFRC